MIFIDSKQKNLSKLVSHTEINPLRFLPLRLAF